MVTYGTDPPTVIAEPYRYNNAKYASLHNQVYNHLPIKAAKKKY